MSDTPPALTARHALFLDFDGTLVGFAKNPQDVVLSPDLVPILTHLSESLGGALAIVTGREITNIVDKLSPLVLPVAGSHGAERRRTDGVIETPGPDIKAEAERISTELHEELDDIPHLLIEHKVYSVAVHYRNAPDAGERVAAASKKVLDRLGGWEGVHGKMVVEIRPDAFSKGSAVRSFMAEPPFAGRTPVFVGDDVTDEDGIAAAMELGGFGIKVGMGDSVAHYRLDGPEAVHRYLSELDL